MEQLGYQKDKNLRFYWLLLTKSLADGLRILLEDKDTNAMSSIVSKFKNFVVYFDHVDIANGVNWDDIAANPVADLPKVLSPHKVQYVPEKVVEKLLVFYSNLEKRKVHQFQTTKGESDCFHDCYYKMEDGDENILNSFVDAH